MRVFCLLITAFSALLLTACNADYGIRVQNSTDIVIDVVVFEFQQGDPDYDFIDDINVGDVETGYVCEPCGLMPGESAVKYSTAEASVEYLVFAREAETDSVIFKRTAGLSQLLGEEVAVKGRSDTPASAVEIVDQR